MSTKTKKIIRWVLTGILTLQFLAAGFAKLTGSWDVMFEAWGYASSFAYVIGVLEILAIAGLYFVISRKWAVFLIIAIMLGAAYTHIVSDEIVRIFHNLALILMALAILLLDRNKKIEE